jgi:hypothetical protein
MDPNQYVLGYNGYMAGGADPAVTRSIESADGVWWKYISKVPAPAVKEILPPQHYP